MKIIVLAGGLSPERDVSLTSGAGICKTLREKGHQAFLLDVFLGLPYDSDRLEEVFDLPDGGLSGKTESCRQPLTSSGSAIPAPVPLAVHYL